MRKTRTSLNIKKNSDVFGYGYIALPEDVERDAYIKKVMKSGKIMVKNEYGFMRRDAIIDETSLSEVKFPLTPYAVGSPVMWAFVPGHQQPVILKVFKNKNELYQINQQNQFHLYRISDDKKNRVGIEGNSQDGSITMYSNSLENSPKLLFRVISPNDTAELDFLVKGKTNVHSNSDITIKSNSSFELKIEDSGGERKGSISYVSGEGLVVTDEFGNSFELSNGLAELITDKFLISSDSINLGGEAGEFLVKGTALNTNLTNLITQLNTLVTILLTFAGAQTAVTATPPLTPLAAAYQVLNTQLPNIITQLAQISGALTNHLSQKSKTE